MSRLAQGARSKASQAIGLRDSRIQVSGLSFESALSTAESYTILHNTQSPNKHCDVLFWGGGWQSRCMHQRKANQGTRYQRCVLLW